MIIGITGSIGSGKTTVANLFSRHHYNRIDADEAYHGLLKKNSVIYRKLITAFGNEILDINKKIDRKKLSDIVFNDAKKLKSLNSITHPAIIKTIKDNINIIQKKCGADAKIIIDAPLLLETKAKDLVDRVIVIKTGTKNILSRNKKISRHQIERILNVQMPLKDKLEYADFVIDNNKDLKHLERQVVKIIGILEDNG